MSNKRTLDMKSPRILIPLFMFLASSVMAMHAGPVPSENIIRLVFMGKTGAGKSTVINGCYNFTKQKKWDDYPKLFPISTEYQPCNIPQYMGRSAECHAREQLDAVTQFPSEYVVQGNNFIVNLIDCPGMADPRGIEKDVENTNMIAQFLAKAGDFNALCIVLKGDTNRGTAEEKYFIEQVKTIIPASAYNRIFIIATHTNLPSENLAAFARSVNLPTENIFYFNNYALSKDGYVDIRDVDISETPIDDIGDPWAEVSVNAADEEKKKTARNIHESYPATHREFNRLVKAARGLGKHTSPEIAEISKIKRGVTEKILTAHRTVESIEACEIGLESARHELSLASDEYNSALGRKKTAEDDLKYAKAEKEAAAALATFTEHSVQERDDRETLTHNTTCMICDYTCHERCGLDPGDPIVGCTMMSDGCCKVCPGHCSSTYHSHKNYLWKTVKKQVELTNNKDRQIRADANYKSIETNLTAKEGDAESKQKEKDTKSTLFAKFDQELAKLTSEKACLQQEIIEFYVQLANVCISPINFQIGEYYDFKLRGEKDPNVKAKLLRDQQFYVEQVELYQARQEANRNI